ncbi:unnamed protein product [Mucor hiemalis]
MNKAVTTETYGGEEYDYYCQDPYAPRQSDKKKKKKTNRHQQQQQHQQYPQQDMYPEKRANSYLPYSNHKRDPYDPVEPIYLQEEVDDLPSFNSPGGNRGPRAPVGSILQDNIAMDMMNEDHNYYTPNSNDETKNELALEPLPAKKKSRWAKLGISGKKLLFCVFGFLAIVVVIGYFVWPRDPVLYFTEAAIAANTIPVFTNNSMVATWNVTFRVDNGNNWIPTNIDNFAISAIERSTGSTTFGTGNSGHLMLRPKSSDQTFNVIINIDFSGDVTNPTLQALFNACLMIKQDPSAPKQSLDVVFDVVYYIAGYVWHTKATVAPMNYFSCPLPDT